MIDLKELNETIKYLEELKEKEEQKQLEELKENIRNELLSNLENILVHFESEIMIKFLKETNREVCFDYNGYEIFRDIKNKLNVKVWEVK